MLHLPTVASLLLLASSISLQLQSHRMLAIAHPTPCVSLRPTPGSQTCRWSGNLDKYKARVVTKGYRQMEGVDYDETFAPTVRFEKSTVHAIGII